MSVLACQCVPTPYGTWLALLALLVLLAGCQGERGYGARATERAEQDAEVRTEPRDAGARMDGADEPVASYDAFCTRYAAASCLRVAVCSPGESLNASLCTALTRYEFALPNQHSCQEGVPPPESFDSARAAECLGLTEQSYQGCQLQRLDSATRRAAEASCLLVAPRPRAAPKERCGASSDLKLCGAPSGQVSACLHGTDGYPDTCGPAHAREEADGRCSLSEECAPGLTCATGQRCAVPAADGAACSRDTDCGSSACTRDGVSLSGACAALPPVLGPEHDRRLLQVSRFGLYLAPAQYVWVHGSDLVWSTPDGTLMRGATEGRAEPVALPGRLLGGNRGRGALTDADLYFLSAEQTITRSALDGTTQQDITVAFEVGALAADHDTVVVAASGCAQLLRLSLEGRVLATASQAVSGNELGDIELSLDGADVWCVNRTSVYRFVSDAPSLQHHDREHDRQHAVAERFESILVHQVFEGSCLAS